MNRSPAELSKFLSLILRHKPEAIALQLDRHGWANIDELIRKSRAAGTEISLEELMNVVESSEKKRFSVSADRQRIRAAQGHSIAVDLCLPPRCPPDFLYHGTATRFLSSILSEGLEPQGRQHVHLSLEEETARQVAQRHGKPMILRVDAACMRVEGLRFFLTANGIWLTARVPVRFLQPLRPY
jgi:putative RNA 2'-phosphotransferase